MYKCLLFLLFFRNVDAATCATSRGAGIPNPVTDEECDEQKTSGNGRVGFFATVGAAGNCTGTSCNMDIAADKAECCTAFATCASPNPVTDEECGKGFLTTVASKNYMIYEQNGNHRQNVGNCGSDRSLEDIANIYECSAAASMLGWTASNFGKQATEERRGKSPYGCYRQRRLLADGSGIGYSLFWNPVGTYENYYDDFFWGLYFPICKVVGICAGASCDMDIPADKNECCMACGVTSASTYSSACLVATCDTGFTPSSDNTACEAVATCASPNAITDEECGEGFFATVGAAGNCAGASCDMNIPADKNECCTRIDQPATTSGNDGPAIGVIVGVISGALLGVTVIGLVVCHFLKIGPYVVSDHRRLKSVETQATEMEEGKSNSESISSKDINALDTVSVADSEAHRTLQINPSSQDGADEAPMVVRVSTAEESLSVFQDSLSPESDEAEEAPAVVRVSTVEL